MCSLTLETGLKRKKRSVFFFILHCLLHPLRMLTSSALRLITLISNITENSKYMTCLLQASIIDISCTPPDFHLSSDTIVFEGLWAYRHSAVQAVVPIMCLSSCSRLDYDDPPSPLTDLSLSIPEPLKDHYQQPIVSLADFMPDSRGVTSNRNSSENETFTI